MRSAKANRFSSKLWMHSLKEKAQSAYHSDDLHRGGTRIRRIEPFLLTYDHWATDAVAIVLHGHLQNVSVSAQTRISRIRHAPVAE